MKKGLYIITSILTIVLGTSLLNHSSVSALDCSSDTENAQCNEICNKETTPASVKLSVNCPEIDKEEASEVLTSDVVRIINVVIAILGIIAVIFIIYGGFQYMISTGDSGKTKKAKDTILYAVIGLIICSLAAAIVNFVIKSSTINNVEKARKQCLEELGGIWEEDTHSCNVNGMHY